MTKTEEYWRNKLKEYGRQDWGSEPSLFAQFAIKYFPKHGRLLELGGGNGQDGEWFAAQGHSVLITDQVPPQVNQKGATTQILDMSEPLEFQENSFDVVYAHLSLHYFDLERTKDLFSEIYRILKSGGVFAFLVNSVHDPEAAEGQEIEPNFYKMRDMDKRFFDMSLAQELTKSFEVVVLDEKGTSYKDRQQGLLKLIRFIGTK